MFFASIQHLLSRCEYLNHPNLTNLSSRGLSLQNFDNRNGWALKADWKSRLCCVAKRHPTVDVRGVSCVCSQLDSWGQGWRGLGEVEVGVAGA